MNDYQIRGLRGLHLRLIPPIFLLLFSAVGGGALIYLSLDLNTDIAPGPPRAAVLFGGSLILLVGAIGFYKNAKWIEWMVWSFHYGDKIPGRLKPTRRYRDTSDLTGDLILLGSSDKEDLVYRVQISSPFLSMPVKKGREIDVEVCIDPNSGTPVAVDSGEFLLWIVKSRKKKQRSA